MNMLRPLSEAPYAPDGPQPLVRDIAHAAAFPVDALGPLRCMAVAVQGMTQAPLAIPAASALAAASLATQGFANVDTLAGPRPLSLFILTVARSGERKSACDAPMLAAIREFEQSEAATHREAMQSWRNRHAIWKTDRDAIIGEARKAKGIKRTAAEADLDALGAEPEAPPSADRIVAEPTFEGLTKLFQTGQPSLGLFSDEGGQFLGGHAMNSENRQKTLAALNSLWMGDPIRRTRAGDGHATLYGRRLAVHLMVQPTVARAFMADPLTTDTGFLARFLICEPPSAIGTRLQANTRRDDAGVAAFNRRLADILAAPMPMDGQTRALQPRVLPLSGDALGLLADFADDLEARQGPGGDLAHITAAASKAAEQAARIAGVMTLWGNLDAREVTATTMADGCKLAAFYLGEAARLASAATISAETDRAEALRGWLLDRFAGSHVRLRDIVNGGPNSLRESVKARAAAGLLESHGWLSRIEPGTVLDGATIKSDAWAINRGGGGA